MAKKYNMPTVSTQKDASASSFCAYVGPTILGHIQGGTIYNKSKAEVLKELAPLVEKLPLVAKLIVTGEELPEAKVNVKRPGNLMYVYYHKLASGKF